MNPLNSVVGLLIAAGVIVAALAGTYHLGKSAGENKVNLAWTKEKKELGDRIIELQKQVSDNLAVYILESDKNETQLRDAKAEHEKSLLGIRAIAADRVRNSEKRAGAYQRMSEGAESQRRNLADHAARLDRSLEEGRLVVGELQATVRQRDRELILLGSQILTDRKLINATTDTPK
jgi:hypothetical protein